MSFLENLPYVQHVHSRFDMRAHAVTRTITPATLTRCYELWSTNVGETEMSLWTETKTYDFFNLPEKVTTRHSEFLMPFLSAQRITTERKVCSQPESHFHPQFSHIFSSLSAESVVPVKCNWLRSSSVSSHLFYFKCSEYFGLNGH